MILVFGEILFDVYPDSRQMGGAPFNFAFHMKKLGLPVRFFSRIGNDALGEKILDFLAAHGFDRSDIQIDPELDTGTVRVEMTHGGHQFSIDPNAAWGRLHYDRRISRALKEPCRLIYFGSMIRHYASGSHLIQRISQNPPRRADLFCDINFRTGFYDLDQILSWLPCVDVLKLNDEELSVFFGASGTEADILDHTRALMTDHHISSVVLTLGSRGSLWVSGEKSCRISAQPADKLIDTVGAGDAFAAVFSAGVIRGMDTPAAMELASQFAGAVCGLKGALPETDAFYQNFRKRIHPG